MAVVIRRRQIQTVVRILQDCRLARATLETPGCAARRIFELSAYAAEIRGLVHDRIAVIQGADGAVGAGAGPARSGVHAEPGSQDTAEVLGRANVGFFHGKGHRNDLTPHVEGAEGAGYTHRRPLVEYCRHACRIGKPEFAGAAIEHTLQFEVDGVPAADILRAFQTPEACVDPAILIFKNRPEVFCRWAERCRVRALIEQAGIDNAVQRH